MSVIAIVNPKGGSGKSTLATHLAAYAAHQGIAVMLGDLDRQKSSQLWLRQRAEQTGITPITHWASDLPSLARHTKGLTIIDTPGGMREFDMARTLMAANAVLMPVGDSLFDRDAAEQCWAMLRAHPRVQSGRLQVAAIGMRLDGRTNADTKLRAWAEHLGLPFIGALRHAKTYVQCSEQGLTIFDLPEHKSQIDRAQWQPVLQWLAPLMPVQAEAAPVASAAPMSADTVAAAGVVPVAVQRPKSTPVVWHELASALQPVKNTKPTAPAQAWSTKIAGYFGSPRALNPQPAYQPSTFAAT
jgi:chromosome partitioning protein